MKHLILVIAIVGSLQSNLALGIFVHPDESSAIDGEHYYSLCEENNPEQSHLCEQATETFENKLSAQQEKESSFSPNEEQTASLD